MLPLRRRCVVCVRRGRRAADAGCDAGAGGACTGATGSSHRGGSDRRPHTGTGGGRGGHTGIGLGGRPGLRASDAQLTSWTTREVMMTRADFMQAWRFAHEIRLVLKEKPEGQAQREEVALKMFKAAIRFHLELRRWTTSHVSYPHVMIAHAPRAIARLGCIAPFGASGGEHMATSSSRPSATTPARPAARPDATAAWCAPFAVASHPLSCSSAAARLWPVACLVARPQNAIVQCFVPSSRPRPRSQLNTANL